MSETFARTVDAMLVGYEHYAEALTIQLARKALSRSGGVTKGETLFDRGAGAGSLTLEGAKVGPRFGRRYRSCHGLASK
jgi:hypothetical protein